MNGLDELLEAYGLAALFLVVLAKSAGAPIPVPADVLMLATAARAAEGKLVAWQAFAALLVALVVGGVAQFALARGPGHQALYRYGRYIGLTPARLDAAVAAVQHGGPLSVGLAILTPGVRAATVVGCGLAGVAFGVFVPGLALGSVLFLSLHFFLAYVGSALLASVASLVPLPVLVSTAAALLLAGLAAWLLIRRRQLGHATLADAVGAWHEAVCPACLALGALAGRNGLGLTRARPAPMPPLTSR